MVGFIAVGMILTIISALLFISGGWVAVGCFLGGLVAFIIGLAIKDYIINNNILHSTNDIQQTQEQQKEQEQNLENNENEKLNSSEQNNNIQSINNEYNIDFTNIILFDEDSVEENAEIQAVQHSDYVAANKFTNNALQI